MSGNRIKSPMPCSLDRNKEVIHTLRTDNSGRRLEWACLTDVSPSFLQTVILGEDRRFYSHHGVDFQAFIAAFSRNVFSGRLRGASTISMQVASVFNANLKAGNGTPGPQAKMAPGSDGACS